MIYSDMVSCEDCGWFGKYSQVLFNNDVCPECQRINTITDIFEEPDTDFMVGDDVWVVCEDEDDHEIYPIQMTLAKIPEGEDRLNTFKRKGNCQQRCLKLSYEQHKDADPCIAGNISYV